MPKTYTAKMVKIETGTETRWELFIKSNYRFLKFWNVVEEIEGEWLVSKNLFQAGERRFKVAQDYSARELN